MKPASWNFESKFSEHITPFFVVQHKLTLLSVSDVHHFQTKTFQIQKGHSKPFLWSVIVQVGRFINAFNLSSVISNSSIILNLEQFCLATFCKILHEVQKVRLSRYQNTKLIRWFVFPSNVCYFRLSKSYSVSKMGIFEVGNDVYWMNEWIETYFFICDKSSSIYMR